MDVRHTRRPPVNRLRDHSVNRLIPNILTMLALCAGMTSVRLGLLQHWEFAVAAIAVAAVLDALDGRIARLLDTSSKFGAELNSLADVIGFGVAPSLLLYLWTMHTAGGLGWAVCLLFAVCCSLRLARFNTKLDNTDLPAWTGPFLLRRSGTRGRRPCLDADDGELRVRNRLLRSPAASSAWSWSGSPSSW